MEITFVGQVVVVTGGGRGLGRVYAGDLGRRGAHVIVNDTGVSVVGSDPDPSPALEVVSLIEAAGGSATADDTDIGDYEAVGDLVKRIIERHGRIDAVICNAGIMRNGAFHQIELPDWEDMLRVNLGGVYNLLRHAWPHFQERRYGRAVLATSSVGLFGNVGQASYSATKMGMLGLMSTLKIEGAPRNITVNAVAPGAVTRMSQENRRQGNAPPVEEGAPRPDAPNSPEFVVPLVTYLASDRCLDSGLVFEAAGGGYNRVGMIRGARLDLTEPTAESIAAAWGDLTKIDGAIPSWADGSYRPPPPGGGPCNATHSLTERTARWISSSRDRVIENRFILPRALLAGVMDAPVSAVDEELRVLSGRSLVEIEGNAVQITDREGLRAASCPCYAEGRRRFEALDVR